MKVTFATGMAIILVMFTLADRAQAQDAAKGEILFKQYCSICHITPDKDQNWNGPSLHGVVGRPAARHSYHSYSAAMDSANIVWTEENLDRFLKDPEAMIRGTRMEIIGIRAPADRSDIIAYLKAASK